jgi:hypothetical protein
MKLKKYIIIALLSIIFISWMNISFAWVVDINTAISPIKQSSIKNTWNWDLVSTIENTWFSLLSSMKIILIWIFVVYMVYAWIKMIISMWTDEERIKSAKKQIRYWLIWIIFVNIPWTIYEAFYKTSNWTIWNPTWNSWSSNTPNWSDSTIINWIAFDYLLNNIIWFLEVVIFFSALFMLIYSWIMLILWGKDPKVVWETKMKLLYSIIVLIFIWFIEAWKNFAFSWKVADWINIFKTLADLILFLSWPIAIFFLTLAWFYFITSAWNEEKIKKWKSIVIYVLLWILILLASYTLLLELGTFNP